MAVKYWDYWSDSAPSTTATTTGSSYYSAWSAATGTASTSSSFTSAVTTIYLTERVVIQRYVLTGFDDWSDYARAVMTRLVNDETNTGFKIKMWMKDVEITDPSIMIRDLDWLMLRLRQVATPADYEKIASHVAQVRAELASGTEARSGETEGLDPQGDGPTAESGGAQP